MFVRINRNFLYAVLLIQPVLVWCGLIYDAYHASLPIGSKKQRKKICDAPSKKNFTWPPPFYLYWRLITLVIKYVGTEPHLSFAWF